MITIGQRVLEEGKRPYIIAEIGSNWKTIDDCLMSVRIAKDCGADCVKYQLFNFQGLYGLEKKSTPASYDKSCELPMEWLPQIKEETRSHGIDLMVSTFDPDGPRQVDPYVEAHKIASSEITNLELLEQVAALGKPIFVSTGGASINDIGLALSALEGCSLVLNYCVGSYPARSSNLYKLDALKRFGYSVGYSDHSMDSAYLPLSAVRNHGAVAIEKHLNAVGVTSPDSPHSLKPAQFKIMVDYLTGNKEVNVGPTIEETDMLLRHKRRLIATQSVKKGDTLTYGDNFGAFRSITPEGDYLTPFAKNLVDGKRALVNIQAGRPIRAIDVDV